MSTQVTYHAKGVALTDKGAEKVREFLDSQGLDVASAGLRVGVRGGGCSGFQYQLAFDEQRLRIGKRERGDREQRLLFLDGFGHSDPLG